MIQIDVRTESIGMAVPSQLCAHSTMTDLEYTDVLCAKHRPAHRAPASFEWRREFNLEFHFVR